MTKKPLESLITRKICDWLFEQKFFFWRNNNVPIYDPRKAIFRAQPKYTPRGLPDIMIIYEGTAIGLEVKRPDAWKISDAQMQMNESFTQNGALYRVVHSLEEVQLFLSEVSTIKLLTPSEKRPQG